MTKYQLFHLLVFILSTFAVNSQSISGYILDKDKEKIPYANIFIRELSTGTSADENGYYYFQVDPGEFNIAYTAIGYESRSMLVKVDKDEVRDVVLAASDNELDEIIIKASKRDPAYEIIRSVIKNKDKFRSQLEGLSSKLYIKATEVREDSDEPSKSKKKKRDRIDEMNPNQTPGELAKQERKKEMDKMSLLEVQMMLHQKFPSSYKEEKTAYEDYGDIRGLYVPRFDQSDFDFYDNIISARDLIETPLISPFSRTSIITYKFKLLETNNEDGVLVHKIKVTPRKKGNSSVSGFVYVNDEIWSINRVDVSVPKGSSKFYDEFNIQKKYVLVSDSIWLTKDLIFEYETKAGKSRAFKGKTQISFEDFEINPSFPDKYFGNEISVLTQEAMDRDSAYWNLHRPVQLSEKELDFVQYTDSLETILNSKEYKDSIQKDFNRIEFLDVIWDGFGFRNHLKKETYWMNPITALWNFEVVGGFRLGAFGAYSRRFEDERFYSNFNQFHVGLANKDVLGSSFHRVKYDPFHDGDVFLDISKGFEQINEFDAFLNQLQVTNYFINTRILLGHNREIVNGLYFGSDFAWNDRGTIEGLETASFLDDIQNEEQEILEFEPYQAFLSTLILSYTPKLKYMREPNRKINLGSRWPTFSLKHVKGWNNLLGSDVDFDYLEFEVAQDIIFGVLGNTRYTAKTGTFLNKDYLEFIDFKRFRESDPVLYSPPLRSFQLLDTSLVTNNPFVEFHAIHHFNGAIINNIPLLKLTKISMVVGGGFLWVEEDKYRHQEIFLGIERIIKLGPRRRLRVGLYGVAADSNQTASDATWKISLDLIDTWKRDWSF